MSIVATYASNLTVLETLSVGVPAALAAKRVITHDQYNTGKTINAGSTPPGTKVAVFEKALAGGVATIDLENLTGTNGAAVVGTGLRVQALKFRNKTGNAADMSIAIGAANGYDGFGAGFKVTVPPDGEVLILTEDAGSNIGATKSDLDLAGAGTEVAELEIVMG